MTRTAVQISTRRLEDDMPAYTLRRYLLVWHAYNGFRQPMAAGKIALPELPPGSVHKEVISWDSFDDLREIHLEIFRPTGYSVLEGSWEKGQ